MIQRNSDSTLNPRRSITIPFFSALLIRDPALWGIVAVQFLLNVFWLSRHTLWLDEAFSALLARRSFSAIHQALRIDAGPPLYYDLLHIWRYLFGESAFALRALSLMLALSITMALYRVGVYSWNRRAGLCAACLFAFSPLTTAYSQEVRNYTLFAALSLAFLALLSRYLLPQKVVTPKTKTLVACILFAVALLYTHNLGWFIGLAGALCVLLFLPERKRLLALVGGGILAAILYLPWVTTFIEQARNTERTIAWIYGFWSPWAIVYTFSTFIPGGFNHSYLQLPTFPVWMQAFNALLFVVVLSLGCLTALHQWEKSALFWMVAMMAGLGGPYLYSLFGSPLYLAGRTDYGLFPIWCLLLGYSLSRIQWRTARTVLLVLFIVQSGWIHGQMLWGEDPISERDGILYLQRQAQPGDWVLCTGLSRPPFEYALGGLGIQFRSYPQDMEQHLAHMSESWYDKHLDWQIEAESVLRQAVDQLPAGARLWVLYSPRSINQPLFDLLDSEHFGTVSGSISTPRLGLRKLGEPLVILRVEPKEPKSTPYEKSKK